MRSPWFVLLLFGLSLSCNSATHGAGGHHPSASPDIERYIARLENPARLEALQVERVLETLQLGPADTVADIGSGPGVFSIPLARAVSEGLIYAVDVEPKQLDALRSRAAAASLANLIPVLASLDDPFLPPGRIDLALVVDTYHHIEERVDYFGRLKRAFSQRGRLAILEWKAGELSMGPPPEHKLADGVREAELEAAGYERVREFTFHDFHDFEIWLPSRGEAR